MEQDIPENVIIKDIDSFIPQIYKARVVKVYDGDTITIVGFPENTDKKLYKFSVRISGIDCPEMRTSSEEEKEFAIKARDTLSSLILNNIVRLENISTDKYGRLLADVWYGEDINISEWLIEKRLAVSYDGGTKKTPESWKAYYLGI